MLQDRSDVVQPLGFEKGGIFFIWTGNKPDNNKEFTDGSVQAFHRPVWL